MSQGVEFEAPAATQQAIDNEKEGDVAGTGNLTHRTQEGKEYDFASIFLKQP